MERPGRSDLETVIGEIRETTDEPIDIAFQLLQDGGFNDDEIMASFMRHGIVEDEATCQDLLNDARQLIAMEDDVNDAVFSLDAQERADERGSSVVTNVYIDKEGNTVISFEDFPTDITE